MNRCPRTIALCFVCAVVSAACSSVTQDLASQDLASETETTTTTTAVPNTTTSTTTIEPDVVTTVTRVPAAELSSVGSVTIDDVQYDFAFECFAGEDGDVLAVGVGEAPTNGSDTQAVVQMFGDQPFVSVLIEDEQALELQIDAPAELFIQDSVIRGSALRFVDAQDQAGVGEALGLGEVTVTCDSFAPGLPDGYASS